MEIKDYISEIVGASRHFVPGEVRVEKRAENDGGGFVVEGYAAKFNEITTIAGVFREVIEPGAFDDILNQDVRCLFNHDANMILARCVNGKGTLTLFIDEVGFGYRFVTPNRTYAIDLADAIKTGDVTQSSFAFKASITEWVEEIGQLDLRRVKKIEILYDVSPVTYPAYMNTTVAVRNHDCFLAEKQREIDEKTGNRSENKGLSLAAAQLIINQNL